MTPVERYGWNGRAVEDGDLVRHSDYEKLKAERDWAKQGEREAENRAVQSARHWAKEIGAVRKERDEARKQEWKRIKKKLLEGNVQDAAFQAAGMKLSPVKPPTPMVLGEALRDGFRAALATLEESADA